MKLRIIILILFTELSIIHAQNPDADDARTNGSGYIPPGQEFFVSGYWTTLPNSPMAVSRSCCVYVVVGGAPYVYQFGGGNSSTELKRVARLNLNTNTWQNNYSTMPTQISAGTAIAMRGDSVVYVFGGNNSPGTLGKTLAYNLYTNIWYTRNDMPTKVTDALVIKYNSSTIFVLCGGDGYFGTSIFVTNKVQAYNINTDSYTYKNDFPIFCSMAGGGIYRDTIISVGGYTTGGIALANCYKGVVNPSTLNITWTPIANYPAGPISRMASYIAVKGTGVGLMCTGGLVGGSVPTAQTHIWNFCTRSCLPGVPDNGLARANYKACGKGDNIVYTVAGFTNTGTGLTEYMTFNSIDGPCQNMVGIEGNGGIIPDKFELKQNYPNPFNPQTTISFSLPEAGNVRIVVTDIQGREAVVIVNRFYTAGNHSVDFRADELSSGIYFYTLTSGAFKDTKKMLLVK